MNFCANCGEKITQLKDIEKEDKFEDNIDKDVENTKKYKEERQSEKISTDLNETQKNKSDKTIKDKFVKTDFLDFFIDKKNNYTKESLYFLHNLCL